MHLLKYPKSFINHPFSNLFVPLDSLLQDLYLRCFLNCLIRPSIYINIVIATYTQVVCQFVMYFIENNLPFMSNIIFALIYSNLYFTAQ